MSDYAMDEIISALANQRSLTVDGFIKRLIKSFIYGIFYRKICFVKQNLY